MATQVPPPDPNTRAPTHKSPPGACDTAVHVFPPADRYPLSEGRLYDAPPGTDFEDLERMHRAIGCERGVIVQATPYKTDYRSTLAALEHFGPRYRGVVVLNDWVTDGELDLLNRAGVRGVRFNFAKFLGLVPEIGTFERVTRRVTELGWHVLLHVEPDDLIEHHKMFRSIPTTFVIDHMAHLDPLRGIKQDAIKLMIDLLQDGRWWVKLSNGDRMSHEGPPYSDVVPIGRTLAEAAPDRAVWGTDWPHVLYKKPKMVNDGDLMNLLAEYVPDETARRKVLVDNASALYGFTDQIAGS